MESGEEVKNHAKTNSPRTNSGNYHRNNNHKSLRASATIANRRQQSWKQKTTSSSGPGATQDGSNRNYYRQNSLVTQKISLSSSYSQPKPSSQAEVSTSITQNAPTLNGAPPLIRSTSTNNIQNCISVKFALEEDKETHFHLTPSYTFAELLDDCRYHWNLAASTRLEFRSPNSGYSWPRKAVILDALSQTSDTQLLLINLDQLHPHPHPSTRISTPLQSSTSSASFINQSDPIYKKSGIKLIQCNTDDLCVSQEITDSEIIRVSSSTRQTRLIWQHPPKTVLIIKKPKNIVITQQLIDIHKWLVSTKRMNVLVEPSVAIELEGMSNTEGMVFKTYSTEESNTDMTSNTNMNSNNNNNNSNNKEDSDKKKDKQKEEGMDGSPLAKSGNGNSSSGGDGNGGVATPRNVENVRRSKLAKHIDFIITLGGDGTLLHVNSVFQNSVPPIISFNLGSLGFLTPFDFPNFQRYLDSVISGDFYITLRQRLDCEITTRSETGKWITSEPYSCFNEIVIDRGPGTTLCSLECYCDELLITTLQADGIIIATATGSTAYSLSAGGTMVHPVVGGICFTPVCPHSLSCRPLFFPDSVILKIKVDEDARTPSWVCCDGRTRVKMEPGDFCVVRASRWPVPCINKSDHIGDWFRSLCDCLHWNDRQKQQAFEGTGAAHRPDRGNVSSGK